MLTKTLTIILTIVIAASFASFLPSSAEASNWQTVTTFTGSADQTTQTFTIAATEWRIVWEYTPDPQYPQYSYMYVFTYPQGETVDYADHFSASGNSQTNGTQYIHEGAKSYYLDIGIANIPSYTITVQQDADTIPGSNPTSNPTFNIWIIVAIIVVVVVVSLIIVVLVLRRRRTSPNYPPPPPPPPRT